MCDFFSWVTNSNNRRYYFDWEQRKQREKLKTPSGQTIDSFDSHSEICAYYDINVDKVNKFEYNPLTKKFAVDQINIKDNSRQDERWVNGLDFKTIMKPLIIKPITNLLDIECASVTEGHIKLLKEWASVRDSVRASVGDSVWASVRDSVWDSVGDSVWYPVRDSVRDSVWASVRYSVRYPVRDSVWYPVRDSVRDSVGGYISSYFDIWDGNNPYQSCIDLWESGLVPSFDGKTWRLHTGRDAKIVYEITEQSIGNDKALHDK